jgi:hypothetical protein
MQLISLKHQRGTVRLNLADLMYALIGAFSQGRLKTFQVCIFHNSGSIDDWMLTADFATLCQFQEQTTATSV